MVYSIHKKNVYVRFLLTGRNEKSINKTKTTIIIKIYRGNYIPLP